MLNFFRTRPFAYACPQCGNLHTGSSYDSETKQYCSAHARELAEAKLKRQRFHADCQKYQTRVEGLIAHLKAADSIEAQTVAQWATTYNNATQSPQAHNSGYQSADLNSQIQALSAAPYFL